MSDASVAGKLGELSSDVKTLTTTVDKLANAQAAQLGIYNEEKLARAVEIAMLKKDLSSLKGTRGSTSFKAIGGAGILGGGLMEFMHAASDWMKGKGL